MSITCQAIARSTRAGIAEVSICAYVSTAINIFSTLINTECCIHNNSIYIHTMGEIVLGWVITSRYVQYSCTLGTLGYQVAVGSTPLGSA